MLCPTLTATASEDVMKDGEAPIETLEEDLRFAFHEADVRDHTIKM